ncbi:MAG: DinB family protein [Bacteroidota bacterium]|nr:DinB family protein [Bacteroidota bacterium]
MQTETVSPAINPPAQALLDELDHELLLTRRVLERAPEDYFSWQPHSKSMTLGKLAWHTADMLGGIESALQTTEVDLATMDFTTPKPANTEALLRQFDAEAAAARAALAAAGPADFAATWTLRHGPHVIMQQSRAATVRHLISHAIHHRGQLSVYLRLLEVPVPYIYGPNADEQTM